MIRFDDIIFQANIIKLKEAVITDIYELAKSYIIILFDFSLFNFSVLLLISFKAFICNLSILEMSNSSSLILLNSSIQPFSTELGLLPHIIGLYFIYL